MGTNRFTDPQLRGERRVIVFGLLVVMTITAGVYLLVADTEYDTWGPVVFATSLVLVTVPLLRWWAGVERNRRLFWLMLLALLVKLGASFVRQAVTEDVYSEQGDSRVYHAQALIWADDVRSGSIELSDRGVLATRPDPTRRVSMILAYVYAAVPGVHNIGNLFFSWLAFLGLFNFYRAFRIGYPEGPALRYAGLVFFLPSLVYWPSSIGKDGWMLFCLGFAALGAAYVFAPRAHFRGFVYLAVGTAGTAIMRPHVSLVLIAGFAVAAAFRAKPDEGVSSHRGHAARIAAIALLVVGFLAVASQVERLFGTEEFGSEAVGAIFDQTVATTEQGGSVLDTQPVRSPADFPMAFVTVLFRPFPWEADNFQAFVTGLEGIFLLGLLLTSWKRLRNWLPEARRRPYLMFAVMYSGAFIVAFSNILNAGILARQRTQMFAFALVAVCVVKDRKATGASRALTDGDGADEAAVGMESAASVVLAD